MTDKDLRPLAPEEEALLERFFSAHRQTVADEGFSEKVARKLPRGSVWLNRAWTMLFTVAIVAVLLSKEGLAQLLAPLKELSLEAHLWLEEMPGLSLSLKDFYSVYLAVAAILLLVFAYTASTERR